MGVGQEGDQEAWGMPMSFGPDRGSVDRLIREDQDAETQLLQLGLVVLVSEAGRRQWGMGWGVSVDPRASFTLFLQGSQDSQKLDTSKVLSSVIIGLGVALLLVIVIMTTALLCTRKR